MSREPYPGWPPSHDVVGRVNNKYRTCVVVDLRSDHKLSQAQLAVLAERLETIADRRESAIAGLEVMVVTSDRFDPVVRRGLRLAGERGDGTSVTDEVGLPGHDPFDD